MRRLLSALALLTALGAPLDGQATAPATPIDSATMRTARTLMQVTKAAETFIGVFEGALENQAANAPQQLPPLFLERFKTAVRADLPNLLEEMATVYARTYTREEMEGFITWFRTPSGQAFIAKQVAVTTASSEIGGRWGGAIAMRVMSDMIQKGEMQAPQ